MVMTTDSESTQWVAETERGMAIAGTRITLCDVMDYLKEDYPLTFIRDAFRLTDDQIQGVMKYIASHKDDVDAEYQASLAAAKEIRHYWEKYNRQRFERIAAAPSRSTYPDARAKLRERKLLRVRQSA